MANIKPPDNLKDLPKSIVSQMILLSTGGFGVVVALAWNEFIKNLVEVYIKPHLGRGSGVWSLLIYAVVITVIAVLVTMQLAMLQKKIEKNDEPQEVIVVKQEKETKKLVLKKKPSNKKTGKQKK